MLYDYDEACPGGCGLVNDCQCGIQRCMVCDFSYYEASEHVCHIGFGELEGVL